MKLLTQSKYTSMSDDIALLSVSRFVTYGITMVASMLLSRFRTLNEYGTYSQILMVVNLFSTLLMMGLPTSLNYFLARADGKEEKNRFLSGYYILNTVLGVFLGIILYCLIPLFQVYFKNIEIGSYGYFIAIYPWTMIITSSVENLLIVHKRAKILALYRIAFSAAELSIIFIVQLCGYGFDKYIFIYLICKILASFIVLYFAIRLDGMFQFKMDWTLVKTILLFSIPLGLSTAAGTLKAEMDKFFIGYFFSTDQYAIYANAAKELPFNFIASSITAVLLPLIAKDIKDNNISIAIDIWKETTIISYMINAYFAFALFAFSKEAIVILYSEKYLQGAMVFGIYALTILFRSTYFGMILQCTGNTKDILICSLITLAINAILNFLLYYLIGFEGPAIATVLATLWSSVYQLWKTHRVIKYPLKSIFPWKEIGIITGINILFTEVFYIIKEHTLIESILGNSLTTILLALCWLGSYVVIFRNMIVNKIKIIRNYM